MLVARSFSPSRADKNASQLALRPGDDMGTASGFVKRASALNIKEKYEYSRQPESALGPSFSRLHCVVI